MSPRPAQLPEDSGPASSSGSSGSNGAPREGPSPVPELGSLEYLTEQRGKVGFPQRTAAFAFGACSSSGWDRLLQSGRKSLLCCSMHAP